MDNAATMETEMEKTLLKKIIRFEMDLGIAGIGEVFGALECGGKVTMRGAKGGVRVVGIDYDE